MDWARAKTILIAVFLIINLFLGYQVFSNRIGNISYVDREKIAEVISYLGTKEVHVEGEIPYRKLDVPALTVQYKQFKTEEAQACLFRPEEKVTAAEGKAFISMISTDTAASIRNGTELHFERTSIPPSAGTVDEQQTRRLIDDQLNALGIKHKEKFERSKAIEDGFLTLRYEQRYKGLAIYNSRMLFSANEYGIRDATLVWFNSVEPVKQKTKIMSPTDALLKAHRFMEANEMLPVKISSIEQGYYFSTGENTELDVSKVVVGTAFPVWKVSTDRGILYINAINLMIEGFRKAM